MSLHQMVVEVHFIKSRLHRPHKDRNATLRVIACTADDLVHMVVAVVCIGLELTSPQLVLNCLDVCLCDVDGRLAELSVQVNALSELVLVWVNFRKDLVHAVILALPELCPQLLSS